jgi:predicted RNA-binding Zn-ribbon protein involved in translation (DUF1610 family)
MSLGDLGGQAVRRLALTFVGRAAYTRSPVRSRKDIVLGRLALEKRLITREQLEECMREQEKEANDPNRTLGSSSSVRPLGTVMLEKGLIRQEDLVGLLEEQADRVKALDSYQKMIKVEYLFGQLLVKFNKCTQLQVNKCLQIQQQRAEKGVSPIPRLGELLVEHGFVDKQTVAEILKMQDKDVLLCTGCGRQFNVVGLETGKTYKCKECGGVMLQKSLLDTLRADETTFGFELPSDNR